MRYEQTVEGKWYDISALQGRLACCDCGLVHDVQFMIDCTKLHVRFNRNERATRARRDQLRRTR